MIFGILFTIEICRNVIWVNIIEELPLLPEEVLKSNSIPTMGLIFHRFDELSSANASLVWVYSDTSVSA